MDKYYFYYKTNNSLYTYEKDYRFLTPIFQFCKDDPNLMLITYEEFATLSLICDNIYT